MSPLCLVVEVATPPRSLSKDHGSPIQFDIWASRNRHISPISGLTKKELVDIASNMPQPF
ncbi:hypothetical protein M413DRAFT_33071 [Hebeloma cylindrosporum]|uniref:Uncharacterized protein n=1 Tax=Hebeloma cylindrosporum TaxID=76867 RepID=A0A0C2X9L8_HEBCY|nr:hypothetical protein M413DRAFT_33071 [Hebeloma cylindrosporum h7]